MRICISGELRLWSHLHDLFMSPVAHSQSRLQYDFVELSYGQADIDVGVFGDLDADLYGISGSFDISEQLFVQAGYGKLELDDIAAEADEIFLGLGWHNPVSANTDVIFDVNYLYVDAEDCSLGVCFSDDESGYSLDIGLRSLMSNDKLELAGSIGYADVGSGDGEAAVSGSARYHFTNSFSGAIAAGFADDVTSYGINLRFAW